MNQSKFNNLSLDAKANYLWDNGYYIDERNCYNKFIVKIYGLCEFYVEVYYNMNKNKIEDIYALETVEDHGMFFRQIDIQNILPEGVELPT